MSRLEQLPRDPYRRHIAIAAERIAMSLRARNPSQRAALEEEAGAHIAEAVRFASETGTSSITNTEDQGSVVGVKGGGLAQPYGLDDASDTQPGGSSITEDVSGSDSQPGGVDEAGSELDDATEHPHHKTLSSHGFIKMGESDYEHEDGRKAKVGYSAEGAPRTRLGTGEEFSDELELDRALAGGSMDDADESETADYTREHGHSPEADEHVRQQLRAFNAYRKSNLGRETVMTFRDWIKWNPLRRGEGRAF